MRPAPPTSAPARTSRSASASRRPGRKGDGQERGRRQGAGHGGGSGRGRGELQGAAAGRVLRGAGRRIADAEDPPAPPLARSFSRSRCCCRRACSRCPADEARKSAGPEELPDLALDRLTGPLPAAARRQEVRVGRRADALAVAVAVAVAVAGLLRAGRHHAEHAPAGARGHLDRPVIASRGVCSSRDTPTMPATWSNSGNASLTTSTGAVSISTRSDISDSSARIVDIRAEPSISDGLGGIDPPAAPAGTSRTARSRSARPRSRCCPRSPRSGPASAACPSAWPTCGLRRSASTRITCLPARAKRPRGSLPRSSCRRP